MTPPPADAARFLRHLDGDGFLPPPEVVDAAPPAANLPRSGRAQAAAFESEVAAFAAAFWSLPPADRRARSRDLTARGFGPAAARLADLVPGFDVVPVPQPDPRAAELADLVRELFVLPPAARATRRLAWLRAAGRRDPAWVAATRTVLRTDLPLARLEPRLFDWYAANLTPAPVPERANRPRPGKDEPARPAGFSPGRPAAPPALTSPVVGTGCSWGLGLFAVLTVLRLFLGGGGKSPNSVTDPPRSPPPITQPWQGGQVR